MKAEIWNTVSRYREDDDIREGTARCSRGFEHSEHLQMSTWARSPIAPRLTPVTCHQAISQKVQWCH
ncbi:hypothetical protein V5799_029224 [Amblyomma americanum]|uniref:Uncharacterized protein n=1 Tax=Amblyomma americanum TaxID=6943 RepID=A0AAQ4ERY5_AMBAM